METATLRSRMSNPVFSTPGALEALQALGASANAADLPAELHEFVHLRASQINGCSVCVDLHSRNLKKLGETDERIVAVGAWRHAPYFSDAERAALALTEAVTRLSDRPDPVPDEIWEEAARHYDEQALAALLISIAMINVWNRLNVSVGQLTGEWTG
jgi:AhpD family alkylhydroperoxidase